MTVATHPLLADYPTYRGLCRGFFRPLVSKKNMRGALKLIRMATFLRAAQFHLPQVVEWYGPSGKGWKLPASERPAVPDSVAYRDAIDTCERLFLEVFWVRWTDNATVGSKA